MKKTLFLLCFFLVGQTLYAQTIQQMVDSLYKYDNYNDNYIKILQQQSIQLVDNELKRLRFTQNGKYQNRIVWIYLKLLESSKNDDKRKELINKLLDFCLSDSLVYCGSCESASKGLQDYGVKYFDNTAINKIIKIFRQTNQVEFYKGQRNDYPKGETILLGGMLNNSSINTEIKKILTKNNYRYIDQVHLALARAGEKASIDYCINKFYKENTFNDKIYVQHKKMDYISYIRNRQCLPFYESILLDEKLYNPEPYYHGYKINDFIIPFMQKDFINFPYKNDSSDFFAGEETSPLVIEVRKWFTQHKDNIQFKYDRF